jgi:hypothetical protein
MAYNITLTNSTPLVTVADGTEDTSATNLVLIGRNYAGYGSALNENFVKLLENFSNSTAPTTPLVGQLWWDSTNKILKAWQGTVWKPIAVSQTSSTTPTNSQSGDLWFNATTGVLSAYNGTTWIAIGPTSPPGTAVTAIAANVAVDSLSGTHIVGNVTVNNKLSGIFSTENTAFTLAAPVSGISVVYPGLNIAGSVTATANVLTSNLTVTNFANINSITGNVANFANANFTGNVKFSGNIAWPASQNLNLSAITTDIVPAANLSYNLGNVSSWWNNIYGTSIHAQYADLAERFEADELYEAGTVVELGGAAEITAVAEDLSEEVFGVISTNAAFVMNSRAGDNNTHPPVAVQGRVPVKVIGKVRKGNRLVSAGNGYARAGERSEITTWNVIGRSLENKDTDGPGVVEAVVKLNS